MILYIVEAQREDGAVECFVHANSTQEAVDEVRENYLVDEVIRVRDWTHTVVRGWK